jgi:hypothetical protein
LKSLVEEIAPLARAEVDARDALKTAETQKALTLHAAGELGADFVAAVGDVDAIPATGAYAVLKAATSVKTSVDNQQAFHDARLDWAKDLLAPLQTAFDDA